MELGRARIVRRFWSSETGLASFEVALWLPVYALVIGLIVDATFLMYGKAEMWSVANDASRLVALGRMDETTAKEWVEDTAAGERGYAATVTKDGDFVTTVVERPFSSVPSLGVVTSLSAKLTAEVHYKIEPTT